MERVGPGVTGGGWETSLSGNFTVKEFAFETAGIAAVCSRKELSF
jgi:hypothetical protein